MSKPVIAIDIDDVLSSQIDVFIKFSNENYGMNLTRADFAEPGEYWGYYEQVWGVGREEADERFRRFLDERYPLRQIITDEVKQAIKHLKNSYDLEVVTSRYAELSEETRAWLAGHFPDTFQGVHFTGLWDGGSEKVTKALICREIGAGYLIDDNIDHCNLAAEAGVKALLLGEWGWNAGKDLHHDVIRVPDWQKVLEYFDARSGQ